MIDSATRGPSAALTTVCGNCLATPRACASRRLLSGRTCCHLCHHAAVTERSR